MVISMLRQPIIVVLGHVDHGKTSLLDKIRQSFVAEKEAGGITQSIGTTEVPVAAIKNICSHILQKFNYEIQLPGLLFIDTPGHEAFTTLRRRGGNIADIAVLVVDINEGLMPQTIESIGILKDTKTPFVIAVNKIDRISGWVSEDDCFAENYPIQSEDVKAEFEKNFYTLIGQLAQHGLNAERFDRITDFTKNVAAVPVSSKTGEGIPDMLVILMGLAQQYLTDKLVTSCHSKGIILEVKDVQGLGTTIDTIIYDGTAHKNDFLVVGGRTPTIAKIRALLIPEPLKDIRTEKKFRSIDEASAAAGIKISAPGLDDVIAGSPIRTAQTFEEAEQLLNELEKEKEEIEIKTENDGLILKADTVGSLEALISIFKNYPIKSATIGHVTKFDVMNADASKDIFNKVLIAFNSKILEDADVIAKDKSVMILQSNVIYRLVEGYDKWIKEQKEAIKKKEIESITRAGKIMVLPGCIFRASNPAIVGCDVLAGFIKPDYDLTKDGVNIVGTVKQLQSDGKNVPEAKISDKVAVSILGPTIGRQVNESDILYTNPTGDDYKKLLKHEKLLTEHEKKVLEEIATMKRKNDPMWGY